VQNGHTAFQGKALFAGVTWIKEQNSANGFRKRLVRVAEHNHVWFPFGQAELEVVSR
jgi:hypothetical protein